MKRKFNPFFLIISALGLYGLIDMLVHRPAVLFQQLAVIVVIGAVVYLLFRYFMKKQAGSEYSSYQKALKRSKRRGSEKQGAAPRNNISPIRRASSPVSGRKKKQKQKQSHLTVIEGKKGKKKNRALF
ncbi:hypothetical protein LRR81_03030 [Metabacillus sp. GX 13764]|uniref:SA1362 family protein n=1 Tax=Metabacillus kandeliae TaxID=2900151 RepID=UPI001E47EDE3|nr:SA1362 family protein [Metabacillus kandeliae]MCD7033189.1 hypothetical protein [Metabacillus kandeliae]